MSTITMNYPDVVRVRRTPAIGRILILSALALIAITTLVLMASAHADLNHRVAISQNSVVPVPVPTAPTTVIQPVPSETPVPASALPSGPSVLPVPVPTSPSQ